MRSLDRLNYLWKNVRGPVLAGEKYAAAWAKTATIYVPDDFKDASGVLSLKKLRSILEPGDIVAIKPQERQRGFLPTKEITGSAWTHTGLVDRHGNIIHQYPALHNKDAPLHSILSNTNTRKHSFNTMAQHARRDIAILRPDATPAQIDDALRFADEALKSKAGYNPRAILGLLTNRDSPLYSASKCPPGKYTCSSLPAWAYRDLNLAPGVAKDFTAPSDYMVSKAIKQIGAYSGEGARPGPRPTSVYDLRNTTLTQPIRSLLSKHPKAEALFLNSPLTKYQKLTVDGASAAVSKLLQAGKFLFDMGRRRA